MASVAAPLQSGLRRGDGAKIARIHKCSTNHVIQVALGNRPGRAALLTTIERYRAKATGESTPASIVGEGDDQS